MMSDPKIVVEGEVKHRENRKWKLRWIIVKKLSPVADCLHLQLYKDSKERCKNGTTKASLSLEGFLAMETGFTLDKESNTLALVCKETVVLLAFDAREMLLQWQAKIKAHVVEEQQYLVQVVLVPPKSKLPCGPARLHLQDYSFSLVSGVPPKLLGIWPIKELRRFGVVDGKFCFEGGSHCGKGKGLHILHTNQTEELMRAFDLASQGRLHGKRKATLHKNSSIDGSSRMSLQLSKCSHKMRESGGSSESSRPLLSNGSCDCISCSSEYSVPRSRIVIDMLYDQPRNICHTIFNSKDIDSMPNDCAAICCCQRANSSNLRHLRDSSDSASSSHSSGICSGTLNISSDNCQHSN